MSLDTFCLRNAPFQTVRSAMFSAVALQPDITLQLDARGVIQSATSSGSLAEEGLESWCGRSWEDTISSDSAEHLAHFVDEARRTGASSLLQFRQRFPSGRELPMEYSAVSLGKGAGFVAIGKSLQVIADLQSRLQEALQAREQDYWKLRDIESRYRLLFDATNEAVLLVRTNNLRIVESNITASRNLGLLPGAEFLPDMSPRDRKAFEALLDKLRDQGRAPSIILHFGRDNAPWSMRASSIDTQNGSFFLFQIAPVGASPIPNEGREDFNCGDLIQRLPDGFVVVDGDANIKSANLTFLDLVQIGAEGAVIGQNLNRWLAKPGANASTILGMIQRHGSVSLLPTTLFGQLGSNMDVEISAVGEKDARPAYFGLLLRDITSRIRKEAAEGSSGALADPLENEAEGFSLEQFVKNATAAMEQRLITSALALSEGNRTIAARKLGLSRQSLHMKLKKYNFE